MANCVEDLSSSGICHQYSLSRYLLLSCGNITHWPQIAVRCSAPDIYMFDNNFHVQKVATDKRCNSLKFNFGFFALVWCVCVCMILISVDIEH